jgi:hypothetical protein
MAVLFLHHKKIIGISNEIDRNNKMDGILNIVGNYESQDTFDGSGGSKRATTQSVVNKMIPGVLVKPSLKSEILPVQIHTFKDPSDVGGGSDTQYNLNELLL